MSFNVSTVAAIIHNMRLAEKKQINSTANNAVATIKNKMKRKETH